MRAKELMEKLKARGFVRSFDSSTPNRFVKYGTTIYFKNIVYKDSKFFHRKEIGNKRIETPIPVGTTINEMLAWLDNKGMKNCEHCEEDLDGALCDKCGKFICESCYVAVAPYFDEPFYVEYVCDECAKGV